MERGVVAWFEALSLYFPEGTEEKYEKTLVRIASLWFESWTQDILNTEQEC
jgi:hypothetical protein